MGEVSPLQREFHRPAGETDNSWPQRTTNVPEPGEPVAPRAPWSSPSTETVTEPSVAWTRTGGDTERVLEPPKARSPLKTTAPAPSRTITRAPEAGAEMTTGTAGATAAPWWFGPPEPLRTTAS